MMMIWQWYIYSSMECTLSRRHVDMWHLEQQWWVDSDEQIDQILMSRLTRDDEQRWSDFDDLAVLKSRCWWTTKIEKWVAAVLMRVLSRGSAVLTSSRTYWRNRWVDVTVSFNCKSKLVLLLRLGYLKPFLAGSKKTRQGPGWRVGALCISRCWFHLTVVAGPKLIQKDYKIICSFVLWFFMI